jgi:hypothetical protein
MGGVAAVVVILVLAVASMPGLKTRSTGAGHLQV